MLSSANLVSLSSKNRQDNFECSLVQCAQHNDEQAFATLFQLHKKNVHSVCLRMTKNEADAEDLSQEAFLQAFRNVNSFRGDSTFSTWLYRLTVNAVLMKFRRRKSPPVLSFEEPVSLESRSLKRGIAKADLSLLGAIDRILLRRAIVELPGGCREILYLHVIAGYEHREIAQLLQCSIGSSKLLLPKAKKKMRLLLTKIRFHRRFAANDSDQNIAEPLLGNLVSIYPSRNTPQFPDKLGRPHETEAGSLSNLESPLSPPTAQGQSNINRRGRKTRTSVTAGEADFCGHFVRTGNVKQASLQAGYSAWWGYELLKTARVQHVLREFEERKNEKSLDKLG
jgi:RNA polymerase sigma-70 factor (ECF subfamily)